MTTHLRGDFKRIEEKGLRRLQQRPRKDAQGRDEAAPRRSRLYICTHCILPRAAIDDRRVGQWRAALVDITICVRLLHEQKDGQAAAFAGFYLLEVWM